MKLLKISVIIFVFLNPAFGQKKVGSKDHFKNQNIQLNEVSDKDFVDPNSFFPLKVENAWQYNTQGGFIKNQTVTYDSLLADKSHLIYLNGSETRNLNWPDYRIDTNYNVYYDPNDWNRLYYKLDAKIGERWWIVKHYDADSNFIEGYMGEIDTIYQGYYLGKFTTFKTIKVYLEYNNFGVVEEFWDHDKVLASGIGLIYESKDGIQPDILISAIIDGDTLGTIVGVKERLDNQTSYLLSQNYPNPFNPVTNISFVIPEKDFVEISIYNSLGEKLIVLLSEIVSSGHHVVKFDGSKYSSGVYFYLLKTKNYVSTKKMILIK